MIALKLESGDVVWMDAVLSFSESYSASVTKHQIESGSSISDHIIQDNARFTISGVITNVDFNRTFDFSNIPTDSVNSEGFEVNMLSRQPDQIQIKTPQTNPLVKLLPDSVRQFVGNDSPPEVIMGTTMIGADVITSEDTLKGMINGFREVDERGNVRQIRELVTIIEYDPDFSVRNFFDNCICTSLSFNQSPDSGDAIYPQVSFEQVRFVTLMSTTFPKNKIKSEIKNKAGEKEQKGNQSVEEKPVPEGEEVAEKQGPSNLQSAAFKIKNPDAPFGGL
jgi:hypothetical protein